MTDTPRLTAAEIDALVQQVEKMTPGMWEVCCDDDPQRIHRAPHLRVPTGRGTFYEPGKSGEDVRGLVALRNAAPALIAEVKVQRETIRQLVIDFQDALNQACCQADEVIDSGGLSAYADGLRLMARLGYFVITGEYGRRVIGNWDIEALTELHARAPAETE